MKVLHDNDLAMAEPYLQNRRAKIEIKRMEVIEYLSCKGSRSYKTTVTLITVSQPCFDMA